MNVTILDLSARHTEEDWQPFWFATADYAGQVVEIPLPSRSQAEVPIDILLREAIEGMENLARALEDFASRKRSERPDLWP